MILKVMDKINKPVSTRKVVKEMLILFAILNVALYFAPTYIPLLANAEGTGLSRNSEFAVAFFYGASFVYNLLRVAHYEINRLDIKGH